MSVPGAEGFDAESLRAQLQRILVSAEFSSAPILSRFLGYVVAHLIDGTAAALKEYTIGVDVFRRGADFDPRVDTIVRVQARRLRERLDRYYATAGLADPLRIVMPKGHYHVEVVTQSPPVEATPRFPPGAAAETIRVLLQAPETEPWRQDLRRNGIPAPRTSLVGRESDISRLHALLTDARGPRLVTLTGAAGSGKTRLAIEAGLQLQAQTGVEPLYVELANVTDGPLLQTTLLHRLGLRITDNTAPIDVVCGYLHHVEHATPMILDNFEQLAGSANLIGSMLDACSSLKLLVTSRVALHLYGEFEYPVSPLDLPERASMPLDELAGVAAVELFVQRAAVARPGFALDSGNAKAIADVCRRFDGLPLGIELVAAQCRTLTPAQLLERFTERLDVPAGNIVDVPDRQRTLRHAIEWSHELLAEPSRKLYQRLAVFAGGFTLEAAEAVANVSGDLGIDVAAGVASLLDNNLLQATLDLDEPRYAMLETIREYGLEQLARSGERDETCKAHAAYFLVLAEEGIGPLAGSARRDWFVRCDLEQDNFWSALDALVARGDGQWALRMVRALYFHWVRRERIALGLRALLLVLDRFDPSDAPALWAHVAVCAGTLECQMGQMAAALPRFQRALELARGCGDRAVEIAALNDLAVWAGLGRRYAEAAALYEDALRLCEARGSDLETAAAMSNLGMARLALGEYEEARKLTDRALETFRGKKEWASVARAINQLGDIEMAAGRYDEAETCYRKSAKLSLELADLNGIARCWTDLGHLALVRRKFDDAASLFADALKIKGKKGFQLGTASLIEGCAALEVARQHFDRGLTLVAAADAVRAAGNHGIDPQQRRLRDDVLKLACAGLTPAQIEACRRNGAAMDVHDTVTYAWQCLADTRPDSSTAN